VSVCIVKCKIVILHQWFYWQWFIAIGFGRTTSDSICHLLDRTVLWTVPNWNLFSQLMERCLFRFGWVDFQDLLHQLASDFYSMKFEFNSNQIQLNLSCMQFHSIFSLEWNLILTKSIHIFHQLIIIGSVWQHRAQVYNNDRQGSELVVNEGEDVSFHEFELWFQCKIWEE